MMVICSPQKNDNANYDLGVHPCETRLQPSRSGGMVVEGNEAIDKRLRTFAAAIPRDPAIL